MKTILSTGAAAFVILVATAPAQTQDKGKPKKAPPFIMEMLKKSPEQFVKEFDKNKDGFLQKDELPPFLQKPFERFDVNSDKKLDRAETAQMLQIMRKLLAGQQPGGQRPDFDALDKNADGRLTRDEVEGTAWAARFTAIDANGDGRIDRREWEAYLSKSADKK